MGDWDSAASHLQRRRSPVSPQIRYTLASILTAATRTWNTGRQADNSYANGAILRCEPRRNLAAEAKMVQVLG